MKLLKIIAWIALLALVVIQFFPVNYNQSDQDTLVTKTDFMLVNKVPALVEKSMRVSCYDCHSNTTKYPWYSKIQPAAWFMEQHVNEGKAELNFNEWGTYSDRRKSSKLRSIIKQIEQNEMPLDSYVLIHRDAILNKTQQNEVIKFMTEIKNTKQ